MLTSRIGHSAKDTDELALYKMMREALIYLTHLDASNMENILLQRLTQAPTLRRSKLFEHVRSQIRLLRS